jgi:hypothetical protein
VGKVCSMHEAGTEIVGSSGNASDLYSRGTRLNISLDTDIPEGDFSWISSSPRGELKDSTFR